MGATFQVQVCPPVRRASETATIQVLTERVLCVAFHVTSLRQWKRWEGGPRPTGAAGHITLYHPQAAAHRRKRRSETVWMGSHPPGPPDTQPNRSASHGAMSPRGRTRGPRTPGVAAGTTALTILPKIHLGAGAPQTLTHRRIRAPRGHGRRPLSRCYVWLSVALWAPCVQSPTSLEAEAASQQGGAP